MQITVKSNVEQAMKGLRRLNKKQIPFAAALGLTNTAKRLAEVERCMLVKQLDQPTHSPFGATVFNGPIKVIMQRADCTVGWSL